MTLENLGNGHDEVGLTVTNLPNGWDYTFRDLNGNSIQRLMLEYGSKVDFKLEVEVSSKHMETEEQLTVKAQSEHDLAQQDQVQLTAEIRMPDLKIQSVEFNPSKMQENKVVQIRILLQNVGTGGANDVVVQFYDNGKWIADDSITYITTGVSGNATAVFTWLPKAGKHNLKFVVDPTTPSRPNGNVLESAEDNNLLQVSKNVSGDDALPGLTSPLALLALLGAVMIAAFGRRRR
jgi:subtilase family serine protease